MQPVTLYIGINITRPTLYSIPLSIPTEGDGSPAEEAPVPGHIQNPSSPEHPHQPGKNKPHTREEASPADTRDHHLALDQAYQAMKRIDRPNTWQGAVGRIKWVMDTLSPIAEVRPISFSSPWLS